MEMVEGGSPEREGKGRRGEAGRRGEERIRKDEVPSSGDFYRVSLGTHTCPLLEENLRLSE